jgi:DNA-binding beta-propeller fold protein YncE
MCRTTSQIRAQRLMTALLPLLLGLPLAGQAWAKKPEPQKAPTLVWPLPPEKPRLKYLGSIYGAADVEPTKKAGFLDRLAGIEHRDFKPTFIKPYGIATDSHDRIYVTDSGQGLIFVLDRGQKRVSFIGRGAQVHLHVPIGITVDRKDRVWVADAVGQHVYAFDTEGNVLMALGQQDEMVNPTAVAVDESRHRLYVVDSKQHALLVYDSESGQLLSRFGQRGNEDGQFNFPTNVALDRAGRIYVTDTMNFRVQVFDPDYKFVDAFGQQGNRFGQFLKPKGVALDNYGNVYVVDSDFDNFQIFDQKRRLLMFLGGMGQLPGTFWLPAGIHIDRHNQIYVADQNNRRIQVFQLLSGETVEPPALPLAIAAAPQPPSQGGKTGVTKTTGPQKALNEIK